MNDKRWAMISALVGFIGGGFSTFSPFLLTFAAIAKSQFIQDTVQYGMWILNPLVFIVAIKSALYYKDDERVPNKVSNLFVLAGAVLLIPVVLTLLATVPGLEAINAVVIKIISNFSRGLEMYFGSLLMGGCLSILSGVSYFLCVKNFKE
ncbi:MAG: hypothetical protein Q3964_05635 [Carnobacterium sp.]|nr:hypothetical protein [Carnobacterium sp.]